jgi:hypothetical protein
MDPDRFERVLREECGDVSELCEAAYETGRQLAHLPD